MHRRVLVVEDQALMAALLREALVAAGFDVECAADAGSAFEAIRNCDPDAVILDIDLGLGPSGFDVGRELEQKRPDIALLYLTDKPEAVPVGNCLSQRAGFLLKRQVADLDTLIAALESVLADRPEDARQEYVPLARLPDLNERQMTALRMVAQGRTNAAIAQRMGFAESTVERWLAQIFRALGVEADPETNVRVEAARRYIAACGMPW